MTTALFYVFGALALTAAILAVTRKNAVASAIWLVVMFFGLAANYVLLEAWFVAVVQVLVYAGAIMVLFLFVIMLLDLRSETLEGTARPKLPLIGVLAALIFLVGGGIAIHHGGLIPATDAEAKTQEEVKALFRDSEMAGGKPAQIKALDGSAKGIGAELFSKWILAFEVTSVLLLGAILGAVILTKRRLV